MVRLFILVLGWWLQGALLHAAPTTTLAFSSDGKTLISNGHGEIRLHSLEDSHVKESIPSEIKRISSFSFSPSGQWLAIAGGAPGRHGQFAIIDWMSRRTVYHSTNAADLNTRVAFNHDGLLVATASADHKATLYEIGRDGLPRRPVVLAGHTGPVLALAFDPANSSLVTAGVDRSLKVWSREGHLVRTMSYHTEAVNALAFRPAVNGRHSECASASDDGSIRVWQPEIGRMVRIVRGHGGGIHTIGYHPDVLSLFSGGKEAIIRQVDASSDEIKGAMRTNQDWIYCIAISPDGTLLASGDWKGNVQIQKLRQDAATAKWSLP